MDWLDGERVRVYLWLFAILNVATLIWLTVSSRNGIDANGFLLGSDFLSFWTAGRMLLAGGDVYDSAAHIAAQRAYFAPEDGYTAFFYPPVFLPFCWPLGFLGYFLALAAWLLCTGGFYLAVVRTWFMATGLKAPLWLLALAFPATVIVITHGQTSFLVAGLLGLGALLVRSRPVLAGVLFGLATIKPQFGLLVPLVLLLTGEWKVIAAAMATAIALVMVSVFAFGADVAIHWFTASGNAQNAMAIGSVGFAKMMSPFAAFRLLGVPPPVAYGLQAAISLGVAILVAGAVRGRPYTLAAGGLMLSGALLVTPFVLDYDFVLLAFPMILIAANGLRSGFRDWEKLALLLAFAMPLFARTLAIHAGVPVMPLVAMLLFAVLLRRAGDEGRAEQLSDNHEREPLRA